MNQINFFTRTHNNADNPEEFDALKVIEHVLSLHPNNRLRTSSLLYKLAVQQYNTTIKNTLERPPIPKWFCGKIDTETGFLIDTDDATIRSNALLSEPLAPPSLSATAINPLRYPQDKCLIRGTPGSYGYSTCNLTPEDTATGGGWWLANVAFYTEPPTVDEGSDPVDGGDTPTIIPSGSVPAWHQCTKASCWDGNNASKRMMNMLSPNFSSSKFNNYLSWQKSRGCNTVHLILCNKGDGEGGGYSIYDRNNMLGTLKTSWIELYKNRIVACRNAGMAVVLWGLTDDDGGWNDKILSNPTKYAEDLKTTGLLSYASTFVLGLEMTETSSSTRAWTQYRDGIRTFFRNGIGVHHNSGRTNFAPIADILFYQVSPGSSVSKIKSETSKAKATGKPVNFFELDRRPNRELCQAALSAGAFGVGNW